MIFYFFVGFAIFAQSTAPTALKNNMHLSKDFDYSAANFKSSFAQNLVASFINAPKSNWKNAKIMRSTFYGANLKDSNFINADLCFTNFSKASLEGADFSGSLLIGARFCDAIVSSTTKGLPLDFNSKGCQ